MREKIGVLFTVVFLTLFIICSPFPITDASAAAVHTVPPAAYAYQELSGSTELIFVDAAVEEQSLLESGFAPGARVVHLDPARDGMLQICETTANARGVSAIHVISHAAPGRLFVGNATVSRESLQRYAAPLKQASRSLRPGGFIMFYGCNLARGAAGERFVTEFAELAGTVVAASTNATGSAVLGGNWILERRTGPIAESRVLSAPGYRHLLATTNFNADVTADQNYTRPYTPGDHTMTDADWSATWLTADILAANSTANTGSYNYVKMDLVPATTGSYTLSVDAATGLLTSDKNDTQIWLYQAPFDPANPLTNVLAVNEDIDYILDATGRWEDGNWLSRISNITLNQGTTYVLVVTTYTPGVTGTASFSVTGPGSVAVSGSTVTSGAAPTYTVTYNGNGNTGGSLPTSGSYVENATVTVAPNSGNLVKTGYTFSGWNTAANGSGTDYAAGSGTFAIAANTTLYAKWTGTLTYSGNGNTGGSVPTDATAYLPGATVTAAANTGTLTRTGYTFAGWNTAADGNGTSYAAGSGTFAMAGSTTLYAKWTGTVTYNGNGSTGGTVPTDGAAYLPGATVTAAANTGTLTRTGYTFAGWNTAADGSGTSYAAGSGTFAMAGSTTLYAKWTGAVTYDGNGNTGGSVPTDATAYLPGATVTVAANTGPLTRTGYTFAGWNTAADGSGTSYAAGSGTFAMAGSTTLYAKWTGAVTYNGNGNTGGSVPTDATAYLPGATVTVAANTGALTRTGYTFAGWNSAANGSGTDYAATGAATFTIASSTTLYAKWTGTVTYNGNGSNGGTVPTDGAAYLPGATVTAAGNTGSLTRTGYTFAGWNSAADGSGTDYAAGSGTFAMAGNATLYAKWTGTVTYNGNGNTGGSVPIDATAYLQGATITAAANTGTLTRTGYTFAGWNTAADGSGTSYAAGSGTFAMAGSTILYAKWTGAVTYNGNGNTGGSVPTDATAYLPGATVTVAANTGALTRTGYTFAGWNSAADGSGTDYAATGAATFTIASSTTLYAKWTGTVTYNGNGNSGGTVPTDGTAYLPGANVTAAGNSGNLTRTGYTFAGWNTAADGSGTDYAAGSGTFAMAGNITLYAKWTGTVTYNGNGNTGGSVPIDATAYLQGATITAAANTGTLTRSGYSFAGWNTAANGSGTDYAAGSGTFAMAGNATLYAKWTGTVTYNGNANTGGSVPTDATAYLLGATVTAAGNTGTLTRTGYTFAGWNTAANGSGTDYAAGSGTFSMSGNTTLYAKWTGTVTYNGNGNTGGAVPTDATAYLPGATVTATGNTGNLTRTGFTFTGWNTAADGTGTNYAAGSGTFSMTGNTVLYVAWGPYSSDNNLSAVSLSSGSIAPAFSSGTVSYSASVPNNVASLNVTPTAADSSATVKVNEVSVTSGAASGAINLNVGSNSIAVLVTAQNGDTKTYTVTVSRAAATQTITFAAAATKSYGDADFGPGATVDTALPLTYASDTPSVATITAGGLVHIVGAGSATITASQAGDSDHLPATTQQTLTVAKATITVTAENKSRDYDTAHPAFTALYSGFVYGESSSAVTGTPTFTTDAVQSSPTGSYAITPVVSGLTAANYNFTAANGTLAIGVASQSISFAPLATKTYGDTAFTLAATGGPSGNPVTFISGNTAVATVSGSTVTITGAGSATITANQDGNENYASATAQQALTVSKAQLTLAGDDKQKSYGEPNPPLTGSFSGFVNGDGASAVTGAATFATTATQGSPTGSYPITPDVSALTAANYTLVAAAGTLAVDVAPQSIAIDAIPAKTYGNAPFDLSAVGGDSGNPVTFASSNGAVATIQGNSVSIVGAGTTTITASQAGSANYASATAQRTLTVWRAPLTVTSQDLSRVFKTANPAFTASYAGFVNGENEGALQGTPELSTSAVLDSPVGGYPITVGAGNLFSSNYDFTYVNGTLTVTRGTPVITWSSPAGIVYGAALGGGQLNAAADIPGSFVYTPAAGTILNVGVHPLNAVFTPADSVNYSGETAGVSLLVGKGGQAITFPTLQLAELGDADFDPGATASSGLPITYISSDPSIATVVDGKLHTVGIGTSTITASQPGNANFGSASASQVLTVRYGTTPPDLFVSAISDGAVTTETTHNISGTVRDVSGIKSLTVNGASVLVGPDGSFSFPIQLISGANTITVIATNNAGITNTDTRTVTLDATAPKLSVTYPPDNAVAIQQAITVTGTIQSLLSGSVAKQASAKLAAAIVDPSLAVTYSVNGSTPQTASLTDTTYSFSTYLDSGMNTIKVFAANAAGQKVEAKRTLSFQPGFSLAITSPGADIRTALGSYTLTGSVTENTTPVSVTITTGTETFTPPVLDGVFQQQLHFTEDKIYQVSVTGVDQNSNSMTVQRNIIHTLPRATTDDGSGGATYGFTIVDALLSLQFSAGALVPQTDQIMRMDVAPMVSGVSVGDGKVDIEDVVVILLMVADLIK